MRYEPPFIITNKMLTLVAQIAEKIGRISNYRAFDYKPHLRHNNHIHSIHSSIAIEANSLSLDEVRGVIASKPCLAHRSKSRRKKHLSSL